MRGGCHAGRTFTAEKVRGSGQAKKAAGTEETAERPGKKSPGGKGLERGRKLRVRLQRSKWGMVMSCFS